MKNLLRLFVVLNALAVLAAVPQRINYQGMLLDNSGLPIDTVVAITFSICDSDVAGNVVWDEVQPTVTVTDGLFNVLLGSVDPIEEAVFASPDRWLAVKVGDDSEMSPRERIATVGYAFRSVFSDSAGTASPSGSAGGELTGTYPNPTIADDVVTIAKIQPDVVSSVDGVVNDGGDIDLIAGSNISITPDDINNTITIEATGIGTGDITAVNAATGLVGGGVSGEVTLALESSYADGSAFDSRFVEEGEYESITTGMIADGQIDNADISNAAEINPSKISGHVWTAENDGPGTGLNADLLDGYNSTYFLSTGGDWGRQGVSSNLYEGNEMLSSKYAALSHGHYGDTFEGSNARNGIYVVNNYTQEAFAGQFLAAGSSGNKIGLFGDALSFSSNVATGVRGTSSNTSNGTSYGGYFAASGGYGTHYGIYSMVVGSGYAGYFSGNAQVTGTLSKGGGSFKIDHPLDPANKYLYHSFVESPDMKNIYDGVVELDGRGEAVIDLPDYFESLNKDFRYQLTCVGAFANVYVADEIQNNRFRIAGGKPDMKVSWQVTGIRKDDFANAHRIIPEVEKESENKGKYLHPAEHGMPESMGLDWKHNQKIQLSQPDRKQR